MIVTLETGWIWPSRILNVWVDPTTFENRIDVKPEIVEWLNKYSEFYNTEYSNSIYLTVDQNYYDFLVVDYDNRKYFYHFPNKEIAMLFKLTWL